MGGRPGISFIHLVFGDNLVDDDAWEIIHRSPCQAHPDRFKIIATVNKPLGEVLPIIFLSQLNAKITRRPESVGYTFQRHNFLIGHDGSVAITFIKDDDELGALKSMTIQTINNAIVYDLTHQESLDELVEKHKTLSPLILYESFKTIEKMDCGECGEASCFAFTAKLYNGEREAHDCFYVNTAIVERNLRPITYKGG